jgi:hypothetical protein
VNFPSTLEDGGAWVALFNKAWRERDVELAERVGRMLLIQSPERSDYANALQQARSQAGNLNSWPSPRVTLQLAPRSGRALLFKRWFTALDLFRRGDAQRSIPLFRAIAGLVPQEAPFAFGMNLRDDEETLNILNRKSTGAESWNLVEEIPALPRPLTVLVSGNQSYIDQYLTGFLESLSAVSPGLHVHIHYSDPKYPPDQQLETARSGHPRLEISGSWSDGRAMKRPVYYACARFLVAPHLMRQTMAPILIVDLDATFKRDPMAHLPILNKVDMGFLISEGGYHWNTVKAGLVWITPTDNGFGFAHGLASYTAATLESGECCWTLDQTALWATHRHLPSICPDAKVINLRVPLDDAGHRTAIAEDLVLQMSVSRERSIARAQAKSKTPPRRSEDPMDNKPDKS